jgi:hypothetical protein
VVLDHGLVEDLHDGAPLGALVQQLGGPVHVVGAEHHVDPGRLVTNEVAVLLGEAAGHHDLHVRPAVLDPLEVAEVAVELVVGVLPDAAGVEHHHIGLGIAGSRNQAVGLEETGDALGVVLVHLAPEGAHGVGAGHGNGRAYRADPSASRAPPPWPPNTSREAGEPAAARPGKRRSRRRTPVGLLPPGGPRRERRETTGRQLPPGGNR